MSNIFPWPTTRQNLSCMELNSSSGPWACTMCSAVIYIYSKIHNQQPIKSILAICVAVDFKQQIQQSIKRRL